MTLQDSAIEATKKKIQSKRLLEAEMYFAENPDIILEINKEQLIATEAIALQILSQNISRKPLGPESQGHKWEPIFQTRI